MADGDKPAHRRRRRSSARAGSTPTASCARWACAARPVLPPEFWILRVAPEPWTPADSLAWIKMKAWDLGANRKNELLRMRLAKTLPQARIDELLPPYPGGAPLEIREETIKLRGGPDVKLLVRVTRHGPVVSDVLRPAAGFAPRCATCRRRSRTWSTPTSTATSASSPPGGFRCASPATI